MSLLALLWIFSLSLQPSLASFPPLCCAGDSYLEVREITVKGSNERSNLQVPSRECLQSEREKVLKFTKLDFVNISSHTEHLVISRDSLGSQIDCHTNRFNSI